LAVFCQKTGLAPLQKRQKQRFWAFFERFWAFFDQFWAFFKPRGRVRPARSGPPRAGPEGVRGPVFNEMLKKRGREETPQKVIIFYIE
jgi:hypothetical protein